jgi:hypothetical protein
MTARMTKEERWKKHLFPLSAGETAERGKMACLDTSTGECVAGQASTTLIHIGSFAEDVDNSAGGSAVPVNVDLDRELVVRYWDNDTGSAVAASDVGSDCYILDDSTVTMTSAGHSKAGRVWAVDTVRGVAVEAFSGSL